MRFHLAAVAVSLVASLVVLPACSSDTEEPAERGNVAARGPCTKSNDCAEPTAECVQQLGVCSGKLGPDAFSIECSKDSVDQCPGYECLLISNENVQNKTGICSMPCQADADCGNEAVCFAQSNIRGCLRSCKADTDCENGFVCVADPGNASRKVCLVQITG